MVTQMRLNGALYEYSLSCLCLRTSPDLKGCPRYFGMFTAVTFLQSTGLFISPSGISELGCATTKTDTAERAYQ